MGSQRVCACLPAELQPFPATCVLCWCFFFPSHRPDCQCVVAPEEPWSPEQGPCCQVSATRKVIFRAQKRTHFELAFRAQNEHGFWAPELGFLRIAFPKRAHNEVAMRAHSGHVFRAEGLLVQEALVLVSSRGSSSRTRMAPCRAPQRTLHLWAHFLPLASATSPG